MKNLCLHFLFCCLFALIESDAKALGAWAFKVIWFWLGYSTACLFLKLRLFCMVFLERVFTIRTAVI